MSPAAWLSNGNDLGVNMDKPELQAGDVFCVDSAGPLSSVIKAIERFNSKDNAADYGHAGIIIDPHGGTFEALATLRYGDISRYAGRRVLIARPMRSTSQGYITLSKKQAQINQIIRDHRGQIYPAWRLLFHLVPPLAKYLSFGSYLVCSELVAKYLNLIDARTGPCSGINPDDLADKWIDSSRFKIIFSGTWSAI